MELVLFIGLQASGKSSFFAERLARSHIRISLDVVKTRHRERRLIETCLELRQSCVVDNTNPTIEERIKYLLWAEKAEVPVIGYYFRSEIAASLERNQRRVSDERIADKGILATYRRLEIPTLQEGFAELRYVALTADGFQVSEWQDDL